MVSCSCCLQFGGPDHTLSRLSSFSGEHYNFCLNSCRAPTTDFGPTVEKDFHAVPERRPVLLIPDINPVSSTSRPPILFVATLLCARKLMELDSDRPSPAKMCAVDNAIANAQFILNRIESEQDQVKVPG